MMWGQWAAWTITACMIALVPTVHRFASWIEWRKGIKAGPYVIAKYKGCNRWIYYIGKRTWLGGYKYVAEANTFEDAVQKLKVLSIDDTEVAWIRSSE